MSTKTFDGQTGRFLASVATCMPLLSSDVMQGWIDNPKALKKALDEALSPSKSQSDIMFAVASDGRTGEEFIRHLKRNDYRVGNYASDVMQKPAFVTTNGVTYRLGLIKGEEFSDVDRTTKNIRAEAARRGWLTPPAEVVPLLREKVSDQEIERLGLWRLVVMHEPIIDSDGGARLLSLDRCGDGRWLGTRYGRPGHRWGREGGFLFLLPQD